MSAFLFVVGFAKNYFLLEVSFCPFLTSPDWLDFQWYGSGFFGPDVPAKTLGRDIILYAVGKQRG